MCGTHIGYDGKEKRLGSDLHQARDDHGGGLSDESIARGELHVMSKLHILGEGESFGHSLH